MSEAPRRRRRPAAQEATAPAMQEMTVPGTREESRVPQPAALQEARRRRNDAVSAAATTPVTPSPAAAPVTHVDGSYGYRRVQQPAPTPRQTRVPVGLERTRRTEQPAQSGADRRTRAERLQAEEAPKSRFPAPMAAAFFLLCVLLAGLLVARTQMTVRLRELEEEREQAYQAVVNAHPVYYDALITQYATENNLQPAFVEAIILNESSFNPLAESSVGARGLMQLMPETASWIAGKLKDTGYSFDQMYDPEQNIRYGTWYLNYLSKLFNGDCATVAAAYHAGQGEVTGWISSGLYSSDGVSLDVDALMDGPTKSYAKKVRTDYAIYNALYHADSPADSTDPAADAAA